MPQLQSSVCANSLRRAFYIGGRGAAGARLPSDKESALCAIPLQPVLAADDVGLDYKIRWMLPQTSLMKKRKSLTFSQFNFF